MSSLPTVGSFLLLKNAWEAWTELHKTTEKHELNDISEHGMFCVSRRQRSRRWFRSCVTEGFLTIAVHCLHVTLTSLSWSLAFPIARWGSCTDFWTFRFLPKYNKELVSKGEGIKWTYFKAKCGLSNLAFGCVKWYHIDAVQLVIKNKWWIYANKLYMNLLKQRSFNYFHEFYNWSRTCRWKNIICKKCGYFFLHTLLWYFFPLWKYWRIP